VQFFIPVEGIRLIIAWLCLALAAGFLLLNWRKVRLFKELHTVVATHERWPSS